MSFSGPAFKVSRKQATIKLRPTGEFYLVNEGKRSMYIDGKPLLPGSKAKLNNNAVIEVSLYRSVSISLSQQTLNSFYFQIACLRLLFLANQELISSMRPDTTKVTAP